jgi:hypothetical protein
MKNVQTQKYSILGTVNAEAQGNPISFLSFNSGTTHTLSELFIYTLRPAEIGNGSA